MSETLEKQQRHDPYFSRTESDWDSIQRLDPVIWPGVPGPLTDEQLESYEREGFLFFPELFSADEVNRLLEHVIALAKAQPHSIPGLIREPNSNAVRSLFQLDILSEECARLFQDPRLLGPARQLLGSEVYLHQSRVNFKPALDGKEFFWHSDFETWHVEDGMPRMRAVSASIFLTPSHEFNGPLIVIPGSHQQFIRCVGKTPNEHYRESLRSQRFGVPHPDALATIVETAGMTAPKGPAGSVLLFECNTLHASAGNLSPTPRVNLFAVYNSVENELQHPFGGQPPRPEFLARRGRNTIGSRSAEC